ncbi:MAG: RidA family protein [Bacteroidota bacterium]
MKKIIGMANPDVPLSPAVRAGDFVFVSGQVPTDPKGAIVGNNIQDQTIAVIRKIEELVKASGGTLDDVVKTTVFLTDISLFSKMNEAYRKYFSKNQPARSCVKVELACDALIEIEAVAYIPAK